MGKKRNIMNPKHTTNIGEITRLKNLNAESIGTPF